MTRPIRKTLELLTKTRNEAAVDVLAPLLDSPVAEIRDGAFEALLKRRSPDGHREVIRRLHDLPLHWRPIVEKFYGRMSTALRDAILGSDTKLCRNACHAILWFREYDLMPALVTAAEDRSNPNSDSAAVTILRLAEELYSELNGPRGYLDRRDPTRIRSHLVNCLESSLIRFSTHKRREMVEAFLLLTGRKNATLQRILCAPLDPCHRPVVESLTACPLDGVIRLLLEFLEEPSAPAAIVHIVGRRSDAAFLTQLFASAREGLSKSARRHLKKIHQIGWIESSGESVARFEPNEQQGLARLIVETGAPHSAQLELLGAILRHGEVEARKGACAALAAFTGQRANRLVSQALDDDDAAVRAEAVRQLRSRRIPGAMESLMAALDDSHAAIREAAQEALAEFSFSRFLASFDGLNEENQVSTGRIVAKADAHTVDLLRVELNSPTSNRRIRAIKMALAMDLIGALAPEIRERLERDDNHFVRLMAAEAIARDNSELTRAALSSALVDRNTSVKEAAKASLMELGALPNGV